MLSPRVCVPQTAAEAVAWRQAGSSLPVPVSFVGGGTALQLAWGVEQPPPPMMLIDVTQGAVPAGVSLREDGHDRTLHLGAATRLEALRTHPLVREHAPLVAQALDTLGALSVRHLATLGGNIGWRWGDTLAPLLVAHAQVEVDAGGPPRPLAEVLREPVLPLLRAVRLTLGAPAAFSVFEKVGARAAFSPTRLAVAITANTPDGRLQDLRIAVTAAQMPTQMPARRLTHAEAVLDGADRAGLPLRACALHEALQADLHDDPEPTRTRLAARLLLGHLSHALALPS